MIEVTGQLTGVRRQVGTQRREAGELRTATVSQTYPSPIEDVWDACTNPERIPRWFLPVTGELRVGGRYQLEGNAGGEVTSCDPPHGFDATWEFGGQVSWVEVRLSAVNPQTTRFELTHLAEVGGDLWDKYGPGAVGVGWDLTVTGLALHLATGADNDPQAFMAWTTGPDGLAFMTGASDSWADASIAAGTDEATARRSAARTLAFYTGQPEPE